MAPPTMVIPRAGSVALGANIRFAAGDYDDCMTLTPSYLRRSEAEVLWENGTAAHHVSNNQKGRAS